MGGNNSAEPELPEPLLPPDKPWREIDGWQKSVRDNLDKLVAKLAPVTNDDNVQIPYFNILLTGQIGSGKSAFFNSVNSICQDKVVSSKAQSGDAARSLTKEYRVYKLKSRNHSHNNQYLSWRICDTMGLEGGIESESDVRNILQAVDGHVPDKHVFTPDRDIIPDAVHGYIENPTLADKAHCVAVVIDASKAALMSESMWKKLRSLREGLNSRDIPTFIILSHIDEACPQIQEDVSTVFRSIKMRGIVEKVSKKLMGLPRNQVFPIKNYDDQIILDDKMDILLLYAIRQMLYACQGHIENKIENSQ